MNVKKESWWKTGLYKNKYRKSFTKSKNVLFIPKLDIYPKTRNFPKKQPKLSYNPKIIRIPEITRMTSANDTRPDPNSGGWRLILGMGARPKPSECKCTRFLEEAYCKGSLIVYIAILTKKFGCGCIMNQIRHAYTITGCTSMKADFFSNVKLIPRQ